MIFALGKGECLAGADDFADEATTKIDRPCPERLARLSGRRFIGQPATQRFVYKLFQALVFFAASAVENSREVIIDREGRTHTSEHRDFDVLRT